MNRQEVYKRIKAWFNEHLEKGDNRLMLIEHEHTLAGNCGVIVIDKAFDNFATGHLETLQGVNIPYTINYYSFLTGGYYDYQPKWESEIK